MHLIELAGVRAQIGAAEILHHVHLTMEAGEIYGFLGPNGAGKKTTNGRSSGFRERDNEYVHQTGGWSDRVGQPGARGSGE